MSIRKCRASDLASVLEIYASSKLDELRFEETEFTLIRLEDDPVRFPKIMEADIYLYETADILGFGAIHDGQIRALFVSPQARGQGVGKQLLKFLLSKSKDHTSLWVTSSNVPAKNLYKSYGFTVSREFSVSYNGIDVLVSEMVRAMPAP